MNILVQVILLAAGFYMLIKGADFFVDGVSAIAERYGIPQLVIGLTIVAMGTSAPEAAVSITAALEGSASITIGNVVGSNIMNILVILGVTAVIVPVAVQMSTLKFEIPYMIIITGLLVVLGVAGGGISRLDGVILWIGFIIYLVYLLDMAKKGKEEVVEEDHESSMLKLVFMSILGVALIIFGSNVSVNAAKELAREAGLTERFIGLTIVALGTSLPELCTSVAAARKGKADIAIGNIVGSNMFNILFVVGTTALITPVEFQTKFIVDGIIAVAAAVLLLVSVIRTKSLRRPAGVVMLLGYAGYLVYLLR
ncbi:MAG: calcium/sodium antiporter [bacterium]|nr:calcium/sodium antiporter [bacterium]